MPSPTDRCAACGHARSEHQRPMYRGTCGAEMFTSSSAHGCWCPGFVESKEPRDAK